MRVISVREADTVQGGNGFVQWGTTAQGGALGAYLGGARLGGTLGAAAGPVGALVGGALGYGAAYLWLNYVA